MTIPLSNFSVLGGSGFQSGQPGTRYFGSSAISITQQPLGGDYRGGDYFQLGVIASSPNGALTYQWRRKNAGGEYINLTEGQGGIFSNVNEATLFVSGIACDGGGEYDCLICDSCGCFPSQSALLTVTSIADFNEDGGIDGADVSAFFAAWEFGEFSSDVNQDGGIDGADVDYFFARWEVAC